MKQSPDRDTWRVLLRRALRIIDSVETSVGAKLDVRLGGGTVLMFRFDHRISKDIDLFIDDVQVLSVLSPRLNDLVAAEALDYSEQANSLKLVFADGDIDIIVAATIIPNATLGQLGANGRTVAVDTTAEILAKKLLYRAGSLKLRDVFDLAAAAALDPASLTAAVDATRSVRPTVLRRLAVLETVDPSSFEKALLPTETGRGLFETMFDRVWQALEANRQSS